MTERRMLPDSFALPVAPATASNLVSANSFFAALEAAGMPKASEEFSVLPQHQVIPSSVVAEIATFVRIFDRITTRDAWRIAALRGVPVIATLRRSETCFFSAWDFHLSPEGNWQLIEFNDNGSGFIFAAIINSLYYEATRQEQNRKIIAPISVSRFKQHIGDLVEREAEAFFGSCPDGLFVVLDDSTSLERGKFRRELDLLCDLLRRRRRRSEVAVPAELCWDGTNLLLSGQAVSFIVNRSTDFFWESADFGALRRAYEIGGVLYGADPFTYATRSDKRLLEWLALPHWDNDLGIELEERELLHSHVPETHLVHRTPPDPVPPCRTPLHRRGLGWSPLVHAICRRDRPDDHLWHLEEYPVPTSDGGPSGITEGRDGAVWFTESLGNKIGRLTTSGAFTDTRSPPCAEP